MKTIGNSVQARFVQVFALVMVLALVAGAGTAQGATVSAAAIPPAPSSVNAWAVAPTLQSFQSGDWVFNEKEPTESPAWKEFSSKLRYDYQGVVPGDYKRTFDDVLTPAGLNMEVCKKSSVIWMTRDLGAGATSYTINIHSNWTGGALINGNTTGIASALKAAPAKGGTAKSANLNSIANAVANHTTVQTMNMAEMKVICSAQFSEEPTAASPKDKVEECASGECDEPKSPNRNPEKVPGSLCTSGEEGVWRGKGRGGADILGNASEAQLALALFPYDGLSAIHAITQGAAQGAAGATGNLPFENVLRWRCTTRYMSYYQSAPATYNTRTTLASVKDDENGKVGNVFDLIQQRDGQNFQTNSNVADAWYKGMKLVSGLNDIVEVGGYLSEALSIESGLTKTGYADKWNELNEKRSIDSKKDFTEFYRVNDGISGVVKSDEKGKNFSSGTGLPATQQAILANGGVLNVEERERQKVVRIVQPYVDFEIRKCTKRSIWQGGGLFDDCTPSISNAVDYSNEKPNTTLTNANEILVDQANHSINRAGNIIAENSQPVASGSVGGNPMTAVAGIMESANMIRGDFAGDLSYCAESAATRVALMLPNFEGFLGSFGELAGMIANISEFVNKVNNITIDCTDAVEKANPPTIDKIGEIGLNTATFTAFLVSPTSATTHLSFVPGDANMIVQKAQYDPETVSWWQVLSVNCNLPGFEMALALAPGSRILSDQIKVGDEYVSTSVGRNINAVAKSPIVDVEVTDPTTRFTPTNYFYARPGTPSALLSFYDKECGFNCINDNNGFGASTANDAVGNSPQNIKYDQDGAENKTGAQMKDENNKDTYGTSFLSKADRINSNFFNIFRDNEERRIRVDTWYPTNPLGTVSSYLDELRNITQNSDDLMDAIKSLITYANNLIDNMTGAGGSLGLLYDGSEPSSTTVTRYEKGTPKMDEFFNMRAVEDTGENKGLKYGEQSLDASKGEEGVALFTGSNNGQGVPRQRAHSLDVQETGSKTSQILDGFYNNFDVKSSWASEKGLPQVFNFKWEYQTASVFPSINSAGFSRKDGTKDKNVYSTHGIGVTLTFLEGKCYAMFGTELGKRTTDMFQANTGTGVPNNLDNNPTGLASQSSIVGDSNEENLYINSLRSTTE